MPKPSGQCSQLEQLIVTNLKASHHAASSRFATHRIIELLAILPKKVKRRVSSMC